MDKKLKSDSVFCGVRLSKQEIQFIDLICNGTPPTTRSNVIRKLITQEIEKRKAPENDKKLMGEALNALKEQIHHNQQYLIYLSSLLTALVRKSSKSDPSEGERMIARAKEEAVRELKVKAILSKERN